MLLPPTGEVLTRNVAADCSSASMDKHHLCITQRDREVLIRLFDDYGFVAVINGACVDKFLKSRFSAKCLKVGSLEPSLQKLLPPQTYLIVVRRGSTPESIAKAVATRCKTGDDKVDSSDKRPIAVKVGRPLRWCHVWNAC